MHAPFDSTNSFFPSKPITLKCQKCYVWHLQFLQSYLSNFFNCNEDRNTYKWPCNPILHCVLSAKHCHRQQSQTPAGTELNSCLACLALFIAGWPRKLKGCLGEGVMHPHKHSHMHAPTQTLPQACIHTNTPTCMHPHKHTPTCMHPHKHTPTCMHPHKHSHMHASTQTLPHACTHTNTPTCMHPHKHSHMHAPTQTLPHACIHTNTPTCMHPHKHTPTRMHPHMHICGHHTVTHTGAIKQLMALSSTHSATPVPPAYHRHPQQFPHQSRLLTTDMLVYIYASMHTPTCIQTSMHTPTCIQTSMHT